MLSYAVLSLCLGALSQGKLLTSPSQLGSTTYDYVIVGGGTAGLTVADRLTENSSVKVLVVEAGGSNAGIQSIQVPWLAPTLSPLQAYDWNFTTVPQAAINNRVIQVPRGRVLGGSSSVNYQSYNRGSDGLWDHWASVTQDSSWSASSMTAYFKKSSKLVPPADGHDTTGQVTPSVHGNGPIEVSVYGFPLETDPLVINASTQLGSRFKFNQDQNSGDLIGYGYAQASVGGGERSSSATAHYQPNQGRANLDVLINTQVTKLLKTGTSGSTPVFKGIQMQQGKTATSYNVTARTEVVLSAGSVGSPQLLMLSGIGDSAALTKLGITPIVNLPSVGQNYHDHPILPQQFSVTSNHTTDNVARNQTLANQYLEEWQSSRKGLYTDAPQNTVGFHKLPSNFSGFASHPDPSFGPKSPNFILIFLDGYSSSGASPTPPTGGYLTIFSALVTPVSRGTLTLASSDPFANPIIDTKFLSDPFDMAAMVQSMKDAATYASAPAFKDYVIGPYGGTANITTDAQREAYIRSSVGSFNHATGTNGMTARNATNGVVNPDLLVKGTSGLRVVDASIFPVIAECALEGTTYMVAEHGADLIKAAQSGHY